jgi:hypothetical protein
MRNKVIDRTAETGNFFDIAAAEEAVFGRSCQKNGFDIGCKRFIGMCHLQLHLKVGNRAESPQQHFSLPNLSVGNR